ncbi:MAG: tRNA (N6-threonylcarbamoyladenosine(37)-N6)-methyltransferase TrmO [Candidatus Aminicenantes bacterium]|nr:tRNA (N6-threonylcarbamoyladenosine(37)-N6)-methyltransferase TrmO [Candidatus Aminicenantes bacterium]NIM80618.1 tRNA (N6-threonylcarbamoyladenosine(37)-N6)-methyltransferase TrmO [Candidatus Aminicenantes bacterium]NIN19999.1 tRNA (N6-threonylcarbamoyladenosine(37)-N6)-methyltransferase TrmO [Candidatus Aminicenantes bacterium]NIN47977.1 tRNA (N6-threonylcarbamoyladenosine(37)-N6)-methyltransferase TrmO [Candidatus Aminicenantes bacterium]NIN89323.1 tRNA (N6-threonylcarbamoyladenosine(37)-
MNEMKPIGRVKTDAKKIPRHWTLSNVEGKLIIEKEYEKGLQDIREGQRIVVIFLFHKSPSFSHQNLIQKPPHKEKQKGVFSICSPIRPNPLGMSVFEVLKVERNIIFVRGIDILDGTPILDIKPYIEAGCES